MTRLFLFLAAWLLPCVSHAEGLAAWLTQINLSLSSMKVVTMQQGVSADKVASTKVQAAQAASSSAIDIYNREQVRKTWDDYGYSGQLINGCYQVGLADTTAQIKGRTDTSAANAAALVYKMSDDGAAAAPGIAGVFGGKVQRSTFPAAASVVKRVERHNLKYCSVSEAAAGYCTLLPNGMQSGDSDYSILYTPGQTYGWDQTEAGADFVKTIAPVKPVPMGSGCSTPACINALKERRAQEPYLSMARFSFLSFVESRSTQATGDAKQAYSK